MAWAAGPNQSLQWTRPERRATEFDRSALKATGGASVAASRSYPREWLDQVPAVVFACLLPGELRIILHPGVGLADGGAPHDVPAALVPPDLWLPNTPLWVQLGDDMRVVRVWRRESSPGG